MDGRGRLALGIVVTIFAAYGVLGSRERPWADARIMYEVAEQVVASGSVFVTTEWPPMSHRGADEIRARVLLAFPGADISYHNDAKRQAIVDSWPAAVDDSAARRDWGFAPRYDEAQAFDEYLVPTIRRQYSTTR
jgi:hypothetical protein